MNKLFISLILMTQFTHANPIYFNHYHNEIKVKSWKQIRDHNIVKQDLDFSCGAASIATLSASLEPTIFLMKKDA